MADRDVVLEFLRRVVATTDADRERDERRLRALEAEGWRIVTSRGDDDREFFDYRTGEALGHFENADDIPRDLYHVERAIDDLPVTHAPRAGLDLPESLAKVVEEWAWDHPRDAQRFAGETSVSTDVRTLFGGATL
jgi:hypothetical protein